MRFFLSVMMDWARSCIAAFKSKWSMADKPRSLPIDIRDTVGIIRLPMLLHIRIKSEAGKAG
jgi:hypothetical protein